MKLHLSMLERLIELPTKDTRELWHLFDDLGLVVKGVEEKSIDRIFNIETLADRGDHLSALGIARELSSRLLTTVNFPATASDLTERKTSVPVRNNTDKCMRYALLEMALPQSMRLTGDVASLMSDDAGKYHSIVHILNYILLEIGQPMHAFDRDKVEGEVIVDLTSSEEEIEALDGFRYKLPKASVVIRDKKKIIAVAGVIGCANSMVTENTQRVLVECASFDPVSVRKTARSMGISTDASYAFERGCDVEFIVPALKRLIYLVGSGGRDAQSAQIVGLTYHEGKPLEKRKVGLRIQTVRAHMNLPRLNEIEITTRLKYLGYVLEPGSNEKEYVATVPSWRLWDVRNEEDLVEDFARSHGLNKVKQALPPLDYEEAPPNEAEFFLSKIEPTLTGNGFCEVITKSFHSADDVQIVSELNPKLCKQYVQIKGAVEKSYSHLKVTNLLTLARLSEQNYRRGVQSFKVYEFGRVFFNTPIKGGTYDHERDVLTLAVSGRWFVNEFRKEESLDEKVFLFKGILECITKALSLEVSFEESSDPFLHPGYQASLICGKEVVGVCGLVHPLIRDKLCLSVEVLYGELNPAAILRLKEDKTLELPSDFPSIKRDITLKIDNKILASKVCGLITKIDNPILKSVGIYDCFKKPEESFRRITYRLSFQSIERTLGHEEVDALMESILGSLKEKHGIELA